MKKIGLYQKSMDAHIEKIGLDKKSLQKKTLGSSQREWHTQMARIQKDADHKRKTMHHHEAIKALEGRLTKHQREEISSLIQKKDQFIRTGHLEEDDKKMFVRAMQALNDMYLAIDDERIHKLTSCTVTLFDMYRRAYFMLDTWKDLGNMITASQSNLIEAYNQWMQTDYEKMNEKERSVQAKSKREMRMEELKEELKVKEGDASLFKFIIGHVGGQCKTGSLNKAGSGAGSFA
jgi:hypothetical protein